MRILIVVPQQDHVSGNWVTAKRFQLGLEKLGHRVMTLEISPEADKSFQEQVVAFAPEVALLLHAFRSGGPWLKNSRVLTTPVVVMLTGTDVNHGLDDPAQSEIIRTILKRATFVILQNPIIASDLSREQPALADKLRVVSPGVILGHEPCDLRSTFGLPKELPLFLLPAGLRPVKGAVGLLKIFDQLSHTGEGFHLAVCGPILDEDYGSKFLAEVKSRQWASYLGVIPPEAMAGAMRGADVIVNNSVSEGLANSLLEAATLGIPILARRNPGNAALVRDKVNGLLFDDDREGARCARQLLKKELRMQLSRPVTSYSFEQEAKELESILGEAAALIGQKRK